MNNTNFELLANRTILYLNNATIVSKLSHWNVRGPNFYEAHLLFDRVHGDIEGLMDPLIEQLRAFGFNPDFELFKGPGISMTTGNASELVELNLDYIMTLLGIINEFFNYSSDQENDPRHVGLADHLGGMASTVLVDQYLLQAWLGH
jgi:DNA-binding ferritin-like protein